MLQPVATSALYVNEKMRILKNHLQPESSTGQEKRLCIVTGIHGDELDGQYVCYEIIKRIRENRKCLTGIVDVYPALNPLGLDSVTRGIPMFDLDMNRIFPGSEDGAVAENIAVQITRDLRGADLCVDVHSSNIYLKEIPQVRVSGDTAKDLLPYAKLLNVDFVWVHASKTVLDATLAHSMNALGVPTLAIEMGVGMRINVEYCRQLVDGLFNLMKELGIWTGEVGAIKQPVVSSDGEVSLINADASGIFIPCVEHCGNAHKGDKLGDILNPFTGKVEQTLYAPCDGVIFTLREYPVVYNGSLIARILGGLTTL